MKDIKNIDIKLGHLVAVRYSWNSYIGEVSLRGLISTGSNRFSFMSGHQIKKEYTYQILGHINPKHKDYNDEVFKWYNSENGDCPVKIKIYENILL